MRRKWLVFLLLATVGLVLLFRYSIRIGADDSSPAALIARLATAKEEEAKQLFKRQSTRWPREAHKFFAAAKFGRWEEATNIYEELQRKYILTNTVPTSGWDGFFAKKYAFLSRYGLTPTNYWPEPFGQQWRPVENVQWAIYQFQRWDPELLRYYATNLIDSIPSNSIFIGGSAPGFFVPAVFWQLRHRADPLEILSPNKFADDTYLEYADNLYGKTVQIPTPEDFSDASSTYMAEVTKRVREGRALPGETISATSGVPTVNSTNAVSELNALLFQRLTTKNRGREIYYDENRHFDWTTPYLVPHGLIMKISHVPVSALAPAEVNRDRIYWQEIVRTLTGVETVEQLTLPQLCDFVERVYLDKNLTGFKGYPRFATNEIAQQTFAQLRFAIARVYEWRAWNQTNLTDKSDMPGEAELAFKQAFALYPRSDDLAWYGALLYSERRTNDLRILAGSFRKFVPGGGTDVYLSTLLTNLP